MFNKIFGFCIFLVLAPSALSQNCGQCMPNFASCINETSYKLCYEETTLGPIDDEVYNCGENEFCTNSENVCEPEPDGVNIISVCDQSSSSSSSGCNSCVGKTNGALICISLTQFAICRGSGTAIAASNPLTCPSGQFCSEELVTNNNLKKVCAPQAVLDYFEAEATCPSIGVVTPSTETPTTATEANVSGFCTSATQTGTYFQVANPNDCRSYVYCERDGLGGFLALDMKCKAGQFYNAAQNRCVTAARCPN